MKLKSLLFLVCFSLFSNVFAANLHMNPNADAEDKKSITKNLTFPGFCQIEIINYLPVPVVVSGTFDDYTTTAFSIPDLDSPHYISLFYGFYCHSQMYITIESPYYLLYEAMTPVNSTIRLYPYLKNQAKAEITTR